jgi:hypothetical protein
VKIIAFFGFPKKSLSNEAPSNPMRQNYLLLTAFAIIFTVKPITGIGSSSAKFGNSIPQQAIIMPAH